MTQPDCLTQPPRTLLLVDDDQRFRERLARALTDRGLVVTPAENGRVALELAKQEAFEGVVTDLKMPGVSGLTLLERLRTLQPEARIVILTGYGTIATAVQAMRLGATSYLVKPVHADRILAAFDETPSPEAGDPEEFPTPSLARLEREHIERVLVECEGNVTKAARVLGIHRRTLQYKLAKFPSSR